LSYDNSVSFNKRHLAFLCEDGVFLAKIHSWKDFLDKLLAKGEDWLTILKAAHEIYHGDLKGFIMLPASKAHRQQYMKSFMKELLLSSI